MRLERGWGGPGLTSHCCAERERERDIRFDKLSLSQDCQLTEEDRQLTQSTLTQDFLKILRWALTASHFILNFKRHFLQSITQQKFYFDNSHRANPDIFHSSLSLYAQSLQIHLSLDGWCQLLSFKGIFF